MDYTRTEPIREFARRRGLSPQTVYDWNKRGLIETFLIGDRRHVVISSYEQLVQRLVTEQAGARLASPNPRVLQHHTVLAARDIDSVHQKAPRRRPAPAVRRRQRRTR